MQCTLFFVGIIVLVFPYVVPFYTRLILCKWSLRIHLKSRLHLNAKSNSGRDGETLGVFNLGQRVTMPRDAILDLLLLERTLLKTSSHLKAENKLEYVWFSKFLKDFSDELAQAKEDSEEPFSGGELRASIDNTNATAGDLADAPSFLTLDKVLTKILSMDHARLSLYKESETNPALSMTIRANISPFKVARVLMQLRDIAAEGKSITFHIVTATQINRRTCARFECAERALTESAARTAELAQLLELVFTENFEASRFAELAGAEGEVVAKKSRRSIFAGYAGEVDPALKEFFNVVNMLVTNTALEAMRAQLLREGDAAAADYLADFVRNIEHSKALQNLLRDRDSSSGPSKGTSASLGEDEDEDDGDFDYGADGAENGRGGFFRTQRLASTAANLPFSLVSPR